MAKSSLAEKKDWVTHPKEFLFAWGFPVLAMMVCEIWYSNINVIVWPVCLAWMGGGCLLNASRCGRLHCFFTGPFFLLMGLVSLLYGLDKVPLGPQGWLWIGGISLIGGLSLTLLPEGLWGRYVSSKC